MFIEAPPPSGETERVYQSSADAQGFVMNLTRAWGWRPDVFEGFAALRNQLTNASTLTQRDQAVIVCATAAQLGDSYCCYAWGRTLVQEGGPESAAAIIQATDNEALTRRDRALAAWSRKVAAAPNSTTQSDVDSLRSEGFSERDIFEATAFIAFRHAFSMVNDALGAQPDWQLAETAHPAIRQAITFGRAAAAKAT